jgi:hypothetical protein
MPIFGIDCGHFSGEMPIFTTDGKVYPADSRERIVFFMIKVLLFWSFKFQSFEFVSNFVLRISDFQGCARFFQTLTHPG